MVKRKIVAVMMAFRVSIILRSRQ